MFTYYARLISFTAMLFFLAGCTQNNYGLSAPQQHVAPQENKWAQQTDIDEGENIDISDLDEGLTESELGMTEEQEVQEVQEPKMKRIPFPVAEYSRLARTGKGTIKGSIYVTTAYGEKVLGGGTRLYLNPVTSYSNQWYADSYVAGNKLEKADSRLYNYLRFTAADSNGAFAFYGVPSGSYYLIGTVKCGTECGFETPQSIRIATRVSVRGNAIVTQDLSRMVN